MYIISYRLLYWSVFHRVTLFSAIFQARQKAQQQVKRKKSGAGRSVKPRNVLDL